MQFKVGEWVKPLGLREAPFQISSIDMTIGDDNEMLIRGHLERTLRLATKGEVIEEIAKSDTWSMPSLKIHTRYTMYGVTGDDRRHIQDGAQMETTAEDSEYYYFRRLDSKIYPLFNKIRKGSRPHRYCLNCMDAIIPEYIMIVIAHNGLRSGEYYKVDLNQFNDTNYHLVDKPTVRALYENVRPAGKAEYELYTNGIKRAATKSKFSPDIIGKWARLTSPGSDSEWNSIGRPHVEPLDVGKPCKVEQYSNNSGGDIVKMGQWWYPTSIVELCDGPEDKGKASVGGYVRVTTDGMYMDVSYKKGEIWRVHNWCTHIIVATRNGKETKLCYGTSPAHRSECEWVGMIAPSEGTSLLDPFFGLTTDSSGTMREAAIIERVDKKYFKGFNEEEFLAKTFNQQLVLNKPVKRAKTRLHL